MLKLLHAWPLSLKAAKLCRHMDGKAAGDSACYLSDCAFRERIDFLYSIWKKKKRGLWCLSAKDNAAFGYQVEAGMVAQFLSWEPKLQQGRVEGTLLTLLLDGPQLGESLLSVLAFVTQFWGTELCAHVAEGTHGHHRYSCAWTRTEVNREAHTVKYDTSLG